jgi:dTDP-4-amino-4,6-dideoxygalactose transaminase
MAVGVHQITEKFEQALCDYTGARYAIAVDNQSNALYLSLIYDNIIGKSISIPCHTYPSVPCEIIRAGGFVNFIPSNTLLKGEYPLIGSRVWDSALRFTHNMYREGMFQCVSFTGAFKILKLSKGGAILLDDPDAYRWFKKARNSGRDECSYHHDKFNMIGVNCYMEPEKAARGLLLMQGFYDINGLPKDIPDVELPYPDLSQFPIYTRRFNSKWECGI